MKILDGLIKAYGAKKQVEVADTLKELNALLVDRDPSVTVVALATLAAVYTHVYFGHSEKAREHLQNIITENSDHAIGVYEEKRKKAGF